MADTTAPKKKSTAHRVVCKTCNHPKSFHKDSKKCSAFGCHCPRLRLKAA